jgi:hypothetical protein
MAITGASATSRVQAVSNLVSTAAAGGTVLANIGSAISTAAQTGSAIRTAMSSLPTAGESVGDIYSAVASFNSGLGANEWRVRLSLPTWPSFMTSPVLKPLQDAGAMIFPYTPEISSPSIAKYQPLNIPHTNFNFHAYQHSEPGPITITAPMNVEDPTQGLYWIAAAHYLRSLTKMFNGSDSKAGNPPPIVNLSGYGEYVFNNVPVVVTNFTLTLPKDTDYISVPVVASSAAVLQGEAQAIGDLASTVGSAFGISDFSAGVGSLAGAAATIAGTAALFGIGGSTSAGITRVPVKSQFQVTLQPMYSRKSTQRFSLDQFVEGGYLNSAPGYI